MVRGWRYSMASLVQRYLQILNLPPKKPTYDYLAEIMTAHLSTFAFENISKLLYFRDHREKGYYHPSLQEFLDGYEKHHFGGMCFVANSHLLTLLKSLGFQGYHVKLGQGHMAIIIQLEKERLYVDCGAAAPFFRPVRFESDPNNQSRFGADVVEIRPVPEEPGLYRYNRYFKEEPTGPLWEFNPDQKRDLSDFKENIIASYAPGATFMKILRCQLWQPEQERSVSLVNNRFSIRYIDGRVENQQLGSIEEIEDVLAHYFQLPKLPVREAVAVLESLGVSIFEVSSSST